MLLAGSFAGWILALLHLLGALSLGGDLVVGLYPFYSAAAAAGWVLGNVCVVRRRRLGAPRRLVAIYLLGPPGILYLLWCMGSSELQRLAPLVPLWGWGIYALFFLVPVTLTRR